MKHGYNMKHRYLKHKQFSMRYTGIYKFQGTRKLKATGGGKEDKYDYEPSSLSGQFYSIRRHLAELGIDIDKPLFNPVREH